MAERAVGSAEHFVAGGVRFVDGPEVGLDLQSSDLAELKAIFEH